MTDINITDILTSGNDANGIFNELMAAINTELSAQYQAGRIKGTDYANVYLGSIQAAIQQAITFALNKEQTMAQINLTNEQIAASQAATALNAYQVQAELDLKARGVAVQEAQSVQDLLNKQEQVRASIQDSDLKEAKINKEIESMGFEDTVKQSQNLEILDSTSRANTELTDKLLSTAKDRVLTDAEISVKTKQVDSMHVEDTVNTAKIDLTKEEITLKQSQVNLSNKELDFKTKEFEELLPIKIQQANSEVSDVIKGIEVKAKQIESMGYEDIIKDKQALDIVSQTAVRNTQSTKDGLIKDEQVTKLQEEIDLLIAQELEVKSKTDIQESQSTQDLANKQAEKSLIDRKAVTEAKNAELGTVKVINASFEGNLLKAQKDKTDSEQGLIVQKIVTETAQAGGSPNANSILGRQASLYAAQTAGFKKEAAYKVTKLTSDLAGVAAATLDSTDVIPANIFGGADLATDLGKMIKELYKESDDDDVDTDGAPV